MDEKGKSIFVVVIVMILTLVLCLILKSVFYKDVGITDNWSLLLLSTLIFGLWGGLVGFNFLVLKRQWLVYEFIFFAFLFLSLFSFNIITLASLLIFVLISWNYRQMVKKESRERLKVNLRWVIGRNLGYWITSLAILVSVVYYFSPGVQERGRDFYIPAKFKDVVTEYTTKTFYSTAPLEIRKQTGSQINNQVRIIVNDMFDRIDIAIQPYIHYIPSILAIGMFLALTALTFVWFWLIIAFSYLWLFIFIKSGLIKLKKEMIEAERISL